MVFQTYLYAVKIIVLQAWRHIVAHHIDANVWVAEAEGVSQLWAILACMVCPAQSGQHSLALSQTTQIKTKVPFCSRSYEMETSLVFFSSRVNLL